MAAGGRWRAAGGLWSGLGAFGLGDGAWCTGGLYTSADPTALAVARFDETGRRLWRCTVPGYRYDDQVDRPTSSLMRTPDGTLRLVVNLRPLYFQPSTGVAVAAFRVEEPDEPAGDRRRPEVGDLGWREFGFVFRKCCRGK